MKKIGEFTARGQNTEEQSRVGMPARIRLFDGRFDTAYKVREFYVWGASFNTSSNPDVLGKLSTSPNVEEASVNFFNAADSREIAWGSSAGSTDTAFNAPPGTVIDPENLIVEDLWFFARSAGAEPVNYLIIMDKYEVTETIGAVSMAKDRASESGSLWMDQV